MLRQTHAHERERLDLASSSFAILWPGGSAVAHAAVALHFILGPPVLGLAAHAHARRPPVVPDAQHLDHVAALEGEFVGGAGFVGPEGGDEVSGVDFVLGVVVFEGLELFAGGLGFWGGGGRRVVVGLGAGGCVVRWLAAAAGRRHAELGGTR